MRFGKPWKSGETVAGFPAQLYKGIGSRFLLLWGILNNVALLVQEVYHAEDCLSLRPEKYTTGNLFNGNSNCNIPELKLYLD